MPRHKHLIDRLDWALLNTFRIIVEEGGVSRAALRLRLTQSAVSHSLKRLETQVGVRLIDRSFRQFQLTGLGVVLFEAATRIYREIIGLDNSLNVAEHTASGTLKLLVVSRIVSETFDEFLTLFQQQYPQVKLNVEMLSSTEILMRIEQNLAAIGLAICREDAKTVHKVLLIPERYSLYCGKHHPLFTHNYITQDQLWSQSFVSFFSEQLGDALSPLAMFRDMYPFKGEIAASSNNFDEVIRLLYAGYGIGFLQDNAVEQEVRKGILRRLPLENFNADIPVYLLWSKQRRLKPAERVFIQGLMTAFNIKGQVLE